jgi:bifunctional non-homologous end joining protein LigD
MPLPSSGFVPPCRRRSGPAGCTRSSTTDIACRWAGEARWCASSPRGYDWTERYPAIAGTAAMLRARSFTLDGQAVVSGEDGIAIFDRLHRRQKVTDAMLYAFDLLELNGEDLRSLGLTDRKARLAKLLGRSSSGIVFNDHSDEDGATIFRHACKLGLEGIVSKRLSSPYRSGPSRDWLKIKNPDSPAMVRHREERW